MKEELLQALNLVSVAWEDQVRPIVNSLGVEQAADYLSEFVTSTTKPHIVSRAGTILAELDQRIWLAAGGRSTEAEALASEAREIFERLGATVWIDRVDAVLPSRVVGAER